MSKRGKFDAVSSFNNLVPLIVQGITGFDQINMASLEQPSTKLDFRLHIKEQPVVDLSSFLEDLMQATIVKCINKSGSSMSIGING